MSSITFDVLTGMQSSTSNHLAPLTYSWTALSEAVRHAGYVTPRGATVQITKPLRGQLRSTDPCSKLNHCGKRQTLLQAQPSQQEVSWPSTAT